MADAMNGEAINRVKQLQMQLKELSSASNKKNDYMEEMKKVNAAGVKARIANIEGNKKSGSPAAVPMPNQNGVWAYKARSPSGGGSTSRNSSFSKGETTKPSAVKAYSASPNSVVNLPDDSKEVKVLVSPGLGKMTILPHKEEETHLIRPSLAKRMAYVEVTKKSFPTSKLTVQGVGKSLVATKRAEKQEG